MDICEKCVYFKDGWCEFWECTVNDDDWCEMFLPEAPYFEEDCDYAPILCVDPENRDCENCPFNADSEWTEEESDC